jgi:hypothetical protein
VVIDFDRQIVVAKMDGNEGKENPYTFSLEEAVENAKLVALAPELKKALYNLVNCAGVTWLPGYKQEVDKVVKQARTVLEKI